MNKVVCLSVLVFFVFGAVHISSAMDGCSTSGHEDHVKDAQNKSGAIDVGNKICPVTGDKIDNETKATYEYKGKIYNFCCPACIGEFKKDPEKYIKKIQEEKTEPRTK